MERGEGKNEGKRWKEKVFSLSSGKEKQRTERFRQMQGPHICSLTKWAEREIRKQLIP